MVSEENLRLYVKQQIVNFEYFPDKGIQKAFFFFGDFWTLGTKNSSMFKQTELSRFFKAPLDEKKLSNSDEI